MDDKLMNNLSYYWDITDAYDQTHFINKTILRKNRANAPEDATIFYFINKISGKLEIKTSSNS
jgi:hypothetical protein